MIISYKNLHEIEKVNLHDAYIENVIYNHADKKINIKLESEWEKNDYDLDFHNVLYYEMTCCDFWGSGYNVICWSKLDTTEIFDKLLRLEIVENSRSKGANQEQTDLSEFFGIEILINSGDRLKIICKSINVNKF